MAQLPYFRPALQWPSLLCFIIVVVVVVGVRWETYAPGLRVFPGVESEFYSFLVATSSMYVHGSSRHPPNRLLRRQVSINNYKVNKIEGKDRKFENEYYLCSEIESVNGG